MRGGHLYATKWDRYTASTYIGLTKNRVILALCKMLIGKLKRDLCRWYKRESETG